MTHLTRQPREGLYYWISLRTLDAKSRIDYYFDSDDTRWNEGLYFLNHDRARSCAADLRGKYLEKREQLASARQTNRSKTLKAIEATAETHLFGKVDPKAKKSELRKVLEGAGEVVELLKAYKAKYEAITDASAEIDKAIIKYIKKYPKI